MKSQAEVPSPIRHRGLAYLSCILAALVLLGGFTSAAPARSRLANSAPPPGVVWFYLEYPADEPKLRGAQLWGCADTTCTQPALLQAWGECLSPECLPAGGQPEPGPQNVLNRLECVQDVCRSAAFQYGRPFFRLALQHGDRLRLSRTALPLPASYGETHYYRVPIQAGDSMLTLEAAVKQERPALPVPPIMPYFGLTLLVELAVVGLYGALRLKGDARSHVSRLVLVALINLLTYPVVWGFFPTLLRFSAPGARAAGWGLAAFALLLSGLLWLAFNASSQRRIVAWSVISGLFFFGGLACLAIYTFSVSYGAVDPALIGLPVWLVVFLAEAYAVGIEGVLLHGFTRRHIPLKDALLISLMMNAASFLIGLLLAW